MALAALLAVAVAVAATYKASPARRKFFLAGWPCSASGRGIGLFGLVGLWLRAELDVKQAEVTDAQLAAVNLHGDPFHPEWNYTIKPLGQ